MDGRFLLKSERERQELMRGSFNDARGGGIWGLAAAPLAAVDQMTFFLVSSRQRSERSRSRVILQVITLSAQKSS